MQKKKMGLLFSINMLVSIVLFISFLFIGVLIFSLIDARFKKIFNLRIGHITKLFSDINRIALESKDLRVLTQNSSAYLKIKKILFIDIYDNDGNSLLSEGININKIKNKNELVVKKEVVRDRKDRIVGYIEVGFSTFYLFRQLFYFKMAVIIIFSFMFILTLIFLNKFIQKLVIDPILYISSQLNKAPKNLNQIEWKSCFKNEVSDLILDINHLYRKIHDSHSHISNIALKLETLADSMQEAIIFIAQDYRLEYVNSAALEMFKFKEEEFLRLYLDDLFLTDNSLQNKISNNIGNWKDLNLESKVIDKNRDTFSVVIKVISVDSLDYLSKFIVTFLDITADQSYRKSLDSKELYFQQFFNLMSVPIIITDNSYGLLDSNLSADRYFNMEKLSRGIDLNSISWFKIMLDKLDDSQDNMISRHYIKHIDKYLNIQFHMINHGSEQRYIFIMRDVSELVIQNFQLLQSKKKVSVGNLVGMLARDIDKFISNIVSTGSLMKEDIINDLECDISQITKYLDVINESGDRAADVLKQLLFLSKKNKGDLCIFNLIVSLENIYKICLSSFPENISINLETFENIAFVKGNQAQVEQLLLNICINVAKVMSKICNTEEGCEGSLSLIISESYLVEAASLCWAIEFRYNGGRIKPKHFNDIFNSFFSEYKLDEDLRLYVIENIVLQNKSKIYINNKIDGCNSFWVYFPVLKGTETNFEKEEMKLAPLSEATILYIDQEEIMRDTTKSILGELGYNVMLADDSHNGLDLFKEFKDNIKLVIADVLLLDIKEKDLFDELVKISKDIKVIFCSGLKESQTLRDFSDSREQVYFISKPFTIYSLGKSIREILK